MRHIFFTSRSVGLPTKAFDDLVVTWGKANQKRGIRSWISCDGVAVAQILQGLAIAVDALSIGVQTGPPIGVEEEPPFCCSRSGW